MKNKIDQNDTKHNYFFKQVSTMQTASFFRFLEMTFSKEHAALFLKSFTNHLPKEHLELFLNMIIPPSAVAGFLAFFEMGLTRYQTTGNLMAYFCFSNYMKYVVDSSKSGFVKNLIIINKDRIAVHLPEEKSTPGERPLSKPSFRLLHLAMSMAMIDTFFTQYYSNMRVISSMKKNPEELQAFLKTISLDSYQGCVNRMNFWRKGMSLKFTKNLLILSVFFGSDLMEQWLSKPQNEDAFSLKSKVLTSLLCGALASPFITVCDASYKLKVLNATPYLQNIRFILQRGLPSLAFSSAWTMFNTASTAVLIKSITQMTHDFCASPVTSNAHPVVVPRAEKTAPLALPCAFGKRNPLTFFSKNQKAKETLPLAVNKEEWTDILQSPSVG